SSRFLNDPLNIFPPAGHNTLINDAIAAIDGINGLSGGQPSTDDLVLRTLNLINEMPELAGIDPYLGIEVLTGIARLKAKEIESHDLAPEPIRQKGLIPSFRSWIAEISDMPAMVNLVRNTKASLPTARDLAITMPTVSDLSLPAQEIGRISIPEMPAISSPINIPSIARAPPAAEMSLDLQPMPALQTSLPLNIEPIPSLQISSSPTLQIKLIEGQDGFELYTKSMYELGSNGQILGVKPHYFVGGDVDKFRLIDRLFGKTGANQLLGMFGPKPASEPGLFQIYASATAQKYPGVQFSRKYSDHGDEFNLAFPKDRYSLDDVKRILGEMRTLVFAQTKLRTTTAILDVDDFVSELRLRGELSDNIHPFYGAVINRLEDGLKAAKDKLGYMEFAITPETPRHRHTDGTMDWVKNSTFVTKVHQGLKRIYTRATVPEYLKRWNLFGTGQPRIPYGTTQVGPRFNPTRSAIAKAGVGNTGVLVVVTPYFRGSRIEHSLAEMDELSRRNLSDSRHPGRYGVKPLNNTIGMGSNSGFDVTGADFAIGAVRVLLDEHMPRSWRRNGLVARRGPENFEIWLPNLKQVDLKNLARNLDRISDKFNRNAQGIEISLEANVVLATDFTNAQGKINIPDMFTALDNLTLSYKAPQPIVTNSRNIVKQFKLDRIADIEQEAGIIEMERMVLADELMKQHEFELSLR
ncbi:hypothetical protein ACFL96_20455, partial [Thermoproteota archaeon]